MVAACSKKEAVWACKRVVKQVEKGNRCVVSVELAACKKEAVVAGTAQCDQEADPDLAV